MLFANITLSEGKKTNKEFLERKQIPYMAFDFLYITSMREENKVRGEMQELAVVVLAGVGVGGTGEGNNTGGKRK